MAGNHAVVVGYRENDPRRWQLRNQVTRADKCIDCDHVVYYVRSGIDAIRSRDALVMCDQCYQSQKEEVQASL